MDRDLFKLRKWCVRKRERGWLVKDIVSHARVSEASFNRWWRVYLKEGLSGLVIKSRAPKVVHKTPVSVINRVIDLRKEHSCSDKLLQAYLLRDGIKLSNSTIYSILKRNGLITPNKPRKQRTFIRWERKHPDSLWQTDYSIYKRKYITAFIDDHSRFCTAGNLFSEATTQHALELLNQAIKDYNKPRQILTDHGSQYYAVKGGVSEFDKYCQNNGIQHIMSGIGKPTTQGKIERFFQTIKKTMDIIPDIKEAIHYYNYVKPHTSLKYQTPAQIYFKKE